MTNFSRFDQSETTFEMSCGIIDYCYETDTFGCYRWRNVAGRKEPEAVANKKKATIPILVESLRYWNLRALFL